MKPFRRPSLGQFSVAPSSTRSVEPSSTRSVEPSSTRSETRLRAEPRVTGKSGQYVTRYAEVRKVLLRYLSPILVDSVLDRAMHARNLSPTLMSEHALAEVTGDIMVGLRLFVPEDQLSQLMLELAETLDQGHS